MNYASLCSGIEAASAAWHPFGWRSVFFSENAPFPSAVLAHHYPGTPNYGDMTNFQEWPDHAVDVLVGGTPCQGFSIAGLRGGLDDPRSNLALAFLGVVDRYRPRVVVWENVAGALSTNGGRDFGTFLGWLEKIGYGFAYRILDAGFFGVFQRRRRVFVVGCLGDWRRAAKILFERTTTADLRKSGAGLPCIDSSGLAKKQTMPERGRCWTVHDGHGHRFLTPVEVERLFGFSDGYTLVPVRGKPAADGPRYRALGNSMAVPVMAWLGSRIQLMAGVQ